jgi:hypothetical protein
MVGRPRIQSGCFHQQPFEKKFPPAARRKSGHDQRILDSAVKLSDEYALGGAKRQTAIVEARRAGINETLLTTPGAARRLRDEIEKDKSFTGGALNPIAEKAKRLNADFEAVKQHLIDIAQLASGSVQDAFSDLLETVDGWLAAHKDTIIWFSIGVVRLWTWWRRLWAWQRARRGS